MTRNLVFGNRKQKLELLCTKSIEELLILDDCKTGSLEHSHSSFTHFLSDVRGLLNEQLPLPLFILYSTSVSKEYSNYLSLFKVYLSSVELSLSSVVFLGGLNSKFYII